VREEFGGVVAYRCLLYSLYLQDQVPLELVFEISLVFNF
jgi:hypothetical protein